MNNISNIPKLNIMNFEGYSNIRTPLYMLDVIWNIWKEFHDDDDKLNSVALVRERTIPTERPPPVGEVSANFCG